jgi:hypothetical protein
MCERLIDMREFHLHLLDAYRRFIDEWRAAQVGLPSLDEYAARLDEAPSMPAAALPSLP